MYVHKHNSGIYLYKNKISYDLSSEQSWNLGEAPSKSFKLC